MFQSKKTKAAVYMCLLLGMMFLFGCGKKKDMGSVEENENAKEERFYDLALGEWKGYEQAESAGETWTTDAFVDDINAEPEAGMEPWSRYGVTEQGVYYFLEEFFVMDGEEMKGAYYVTMVDASSLQKKSIKLDFSGEVAETADLPDLNGVIPAEEMPVMMGFDAAGEDICVFVQQLNADQSDTKHLFAVRFDREGKVKKVSDLAPAMRQEFSERGIILKNHANTDREGNYYLRDSKGASVLVTDGEGGVLAVMEKEPSVDEAVLCAFKLPDGRPVFGYMSYAENQGTATYFCYDKGKRILFRGGADLIETGCADVHGNIVFVGSQGIMEWNASEGKCRKLYGAEGIEEYECDGIVKNSGDEMVVFFHRRDSAYLYRLRKGVSEDLKEIRIVDLSGASKYTSACAAQYSREHGDVHITMEVLEDNRDIALNQVMAEIMNGGGPDMVVVDRRNLKILQEKGVLADMTGVMPEETLNQIFAGVLAYGTIGGKLYGIAPRASLSTLFAKKDVWAGPSWRMQEMIALMEQGRCERVLDGTINGAHLMLNLMLRDVAHCGFVDLESYTCSFDTDAFRSQLEFFGRYGTAASGEYMTDEEKIQNVLDGRTLAFSFGGGLSAFSRVVAQAEDDFMCIGYPTEGISGSYVACNESIAVNAGTGEMAVVSDFLQYMMSKEAQRRYADTSSVRRDVFTEYVKDGLADDGRGDEKSPYFLLNDGNAIPLDGRLDGSSFVKEYIEQMDKAMPEGTETEVMDIVFEEVQSYYNGSKTAEEVAGLIQNRVQLYLNERRH